MNGTPALNISTMEPIVKSPTTATTQTVQDWFTARPKKRTTIDNGITTVRVSATTTATTTTRPDSPNNVVPAPSSMSELPLDWTRMKSKRKRLNSQEEDENEEGRNCIRCNRNGQNCCRPITSNSSGSQSLLRRQLQGCAIFCLLESDPNWFQGYFFAKTAQQQDCSVPVGLLAIQRAVEDCLACSEGGYRQIDLQICKSQVTITNIEWTGGDMMNLRDGRGFSFAAQRIQTGPEAYFMARQVFNKLVRQQEQINPNQDFEVVFPDLLIVAGSMELLLPVDPTTEKELYSLIQEKSEQE